MIGGVNIVESLHAVTRSQARVYPKRRAKNASHRQRMNNKWLKRYGQKETPAMYKMRDPFTGSDSFVVHPALMPDIRCALSSGEKHA